MIALLPPNHLRRQQRSDGGYDMVPAYTADEVRSHMLSWAENRVAEERERCVREIREIMKIAYFTESTSAGLAVMLEQELDKMEGAS